jgi:hypothetical protein
LINQKQTEQKMRNVSASTRSVTDIEMTTVTTVYTIDGNSSRNLNPTIERIEVSGQKERRMKGAKKEPEEIQTIAQNVKDEDSEIVKR